MNEQEHQKILENLKNPAIRRRLIEAIDGADTDIDMDLLSRYVAHTLTGDTKDSSALIEPDDREFVELMLERSDDWKLAYDELYAEASGTIAGIRNESDPSNEGAADREAKHGSSKSDGGNVYKMTIWFGAIAATLAVIYVTGIIVGDNRLESLEIPDVPVERSAAENWMDEPIHSLDSLITAGSYKEAISIAATLRANSSQKARILGDLYSARLYLGKSERTILGAYKMYDQTDLRGAIESSDAAMEELIAANGNEARQYRLYAYAQYYKMTAHFLLRERDAARRILSDLETKDAGLTSELSHFRSLLN
ncbi:MAG: hypothetical protein CL946_09870 [Ectothiorhodospiraceae bacterium]|nr:hypothetical protein [Ectothiorhodospiraceae bacterium]